MELLRTAMRLRPYFDEIDVSNIAQVCVSLRRESDDYRTHTRGARREVYCQACASLVCARSVVAALPCCRDCAIAREGQACSKRQLARAVPGVGIKRLRRVVPRTSDGYSRDCAACVAIATAGTPSAWMDARRRLTDQKKLILTHQAYRAAKKKLQREEWTTGGE